jgi:transposase-like protein
VRSFRMITSFFYVKGFVQQSDLCRTFGVTPIAVKRAVKKYREEGSGGFYAERRVRGAAVLLPDVLEKDLLAEGGVRVTAVASQLGVGADTLREAIETGRVRVKKTVNSQT